MVLSPIAGAQAAELKVLAEGPCLAIHHTDAALADISPPWPTSSTPAHQE